LAVEALREEARRLLEHSKALGLESGQMQQPYTGICPQVLTEIESR
jgi:hypothetical protein